MYICDIVNDQGKLYPYSDMVQRYGNQFTRLQYKALISAIPLKWKTIIKQEYENELNMFRFYDHVSKKPKKVQYRYQKCRQVEAEPNSNQSTAPVKGTR